MPDDKSIAVDADDDGVAIVTLRRPDHLNAMSASMGAALAQALDDVDANPDVRAVIITGSGRAFCAGADLSSGAEAFAPRPGARERDSPRRDWGGVLVLRLFAMNKPTIAAVNGAAVGVGATLTLPCDFRIASSSARFGFVFARRGIVTDGCASWFLPRVVGISTALDWCLTGRLVPANEARDADLVSEVCPPDVLIASARALATRIAVESSPVSVALTRRLLWQGLVEDHPMDAHRFESLLIDFTSRSEDAREGVTSFLEKRPASFSSHVPGDLPVPWPPWVEPSF
jgi:enoyl-CoA hydratase/carnithine racemase